jgi:hypothetical protein
MTMEKEGLKVSLPDMGIADLKAQERALLKRDEIAEDPTLGFVKDSLSPLAKSEGFLGSRTATRRTLQTSRQLARSTAWGVAYEGFWSEQLDYWNRPAGRSGLPQEQTDRAPALDNKAKKVAKKLAKAEKLGPKIQCTRCRKYGSHTAAECRAPLLVKKTEVKNKPSKIICWNCGLPGHTANSCAKPKLVPYRFKPEKEGEAMVAESVMPSAVLCAKLPVVKPQVVRHAADPRDPHKVFVNVVSSGVDKIIQVYSLLSGRVTHSWIAASLAEGYPRLVVPPRDFDTGGLSATCLGFVRLPMWTGQEVIWLDMVAVMPDNQLPKDTKLMLCSFDSELLHIDLHDVRERYKKGERLFDAKYEEQINPATNISELHRSEGDFPSSLSEYLQTDSTENKGPEDTVGRPLKKTIGSPRAVNQRFRVVIPKFRKREVVGKLQGTGGSGQLQWPRGSCTESTLLTGFSSLELSQSFLNTKAWDGHSFILAVIIFLRDHVLLSSMHGWSEVKLGTWSS